MKTGKSLIAFATEIERRRDAKKDILVPSPYIEMIDQGKEIVYANPLDEGGKVVNKGVRLNVIGEANYDINAVAHGQLGEICGIPAAYYKRMLADAPELLAKNVNRWLHDLPEGGKPAVRRVRVLDGTARAVLSDRYRPLENEDLAEAVLPVIQDLELDIMSCEITDRRLYIKAIDPRATRAIKAAGGAWGDGKHNIVKFREACPAVTISNSEVGCGALSVLAGLYDGGCTNLATFGERSVRKYHVGKKHELLSDEMFALLSPDTRQATDVALWKQIRDVVKIAFDLTQFNALVDKVEGTVADKIEGDPIEVVTFTAKKFNATEAEGKSILRHLIEGGQLNRFGLYNAITRTAQDLESYDRATEFEAIGGKLIELPRKEWNQLALAKAA